MSDSPSEGGGTEMTTTTLAVSTTIPPQSPPPMSGTQTPDEMFDGPITAGPSGAANQQRWLDRNDAALQAGRHSDVEFDDHGQSRWAGDMRPTSERQRQRDRGHFVA